VRHSNKKSHASLLFQQPLSNGQRVDNHRRAV
jgi:hypothetical protein